MKTNKAIKVTRGTKLYCPTCHSGDFNLVITDYDLRDPETTEGDFNIVCSKCGSVIFKSDFDFLVGTDGFETRKFHFLEKQYTEQEVEDEDYGGFVESGVRTVIKEVKRKRPRKTNDSQ